MMKNGIIFGLLVIVSSLSLVNIASACTTIDWRFTLNIGNLNVDTDKLEELCTQETCTISEDFITIKSHYDERVAVIIGKTVSILGFKGITIRLPYELNEEGVPTISEIDPETFNWKESVKTDLNFLKMTGVLKIEDSEVEKISNLATNGKNILYCKNDWKLLNSNCICDDEGRELCVKCAGAPAFATFLPQKLLTIEPPIGEIEKQVEANQTYFYYLILLIILVIIILMVLLKKVKTKF